MINWGVNCEQNVEKIVFVSVYTGTKLFFATFNSQSTPICHLATAGAKRCVEV
jgi:hypothetical protein